MIDKIKVYRHPLSKYPYEPSWIVEIPGGFRNRPGSSLPGPSYRRMVIYSTWERAVTEAFAIARNQGRTVWK